MISERKRHYLFIWLFLGIVTISLASNDIVNRLDQAIDLLGADNALSEKIAKSILDESRIEENEYGIVKSNFILGYISKSEGNFGKAVIYYLEGIRFATDADYEDSRKDLLSLLKNTAIIFQQFKNYELSEKYFSKALDVAETLGQPNLYAKLVFVVSKLYLEKGEHDKAVEMLKATFDYFPQIENRTISNIYNQLGLIYVDNGNYTEAVDYYEKLIHFTKNKADLVSYLHYAYHNLGDVHFRNEEYNKAVEYFSKALHGLKTANTTPKSLFITLKDLGESYLKLGDLGKAEEYLIEAELHFDKSKEAPKFYELHKLLASVSMEKGDFEKYTNYQVTYVSNLEAFLQEQQQIEATDKKYNLDLITQRYFAMVAEQERNEQLQYYASVGAGFFISLILLILGVVQYRKYQLRKSLERELRPYVDNL